MVSKPVASFTIPSIYDDTPLDCRIYHPEHFVPNHGESSWRKKGAIVTHPYAPLGGSHDDPVVVSALGEILKQGFVVGTFNFRGAASSRGRTSWTAKPELWDLISFCGFFVHYVNGIRPPWVHHTMRPSESPVISPLSTIQSELPSQADLYEQTDRGMTLLLGGYSYGSLITSNLPNTETILSHFSTVHKGTSEAEIRLRAFHMSTQWNAEVTPRPMRGRSLAVSTHAITLGGEESEPGTRRNSRDSRSSLEFVRRNKDLPRARRSSTRHSTDIDAPLLEEKLGNMRMAEPHTIYLLISPLLPPVSMFATMFNKPGALLKWQGGSPDVTNGDVNPIAEEKFRRHATLAIYGDKDFFTSHKRLRKWAERLTSAIDSHFTFREIHNAGHFWHEEGVDAEMRKCIREWVIDVMGGFSTAHKDEK
ncbi:hypothetical protein MMC32_003523 [Xylographa parallela]|nr:hypothetical protein [Xylographa parallela]